MSDAQSGDGTIIKQWLSNDGIYRYADCCKLLEKAIIHGNLTTVKLLINSVGARNVNLMSTFLALACEHQHKDIVDWLLKTTETRLDYEVNRKKVSISEICCENGNLEILKSLLIYNPTRLYGTDTQQWKTELGIACKKGHLKMVKFLVLTRDIDLLRIFWKKDHPLIQAVLGGQLTIVDWMINFYHHQTANIQYHIGAIIADLLMCSSENGHWHIVKYLCERFKFNVNNTVATYVPFNGYNFEGQCKFNTPIHFIICVDVDEGQNFLHKAVIDGNIKMVSYYIRSMTDTEINKQDNNGNTALHLACQRKFDAISTEIIQRLLLCSNTTITNDKKLTPCQLLKAELTPKNWKTKFIDKLFDRDNCYYLSLWLMNRWPRVILVYLCVIMLQREVIQAKNIKFGSFRKVK